MIREGRPLPPNVLDRLPDLLEAVKRDPDIIALLAFGSLATGKLSPLSDLDFAILLPFDLDSLKRFEKHLELINTFIDTFNTEEIDLILLNEAPPRYAHQILAQGKILFCRDRAALADFIESTRKRYLDFRPYMEQFDREFLRGIGYSG